MNYYFYPLSLHTLAAHTNHTSILHHVILCSTYISYNICFPSFSTMQHIHTIQHHSTSCNTVHTQRRLVTLHSDQCGRKKNFQQPKTVKGQTRQFLGRSGTGIKNIQLEVKAVNDMVAFFQWSQQVFWQLVPCPSLQPRNRHRLMLGQSIQRSEMLCSQSECHQS